MQTITKLCADHLRTFTNDNYGIKLKASHAHELVAAYFGYQSKAALLADTRYPLGNLRQAEIVVLTPTDLIDQRRKSLQGLPHDLPDTYTLGEGVYIPLFSERWIVTPTPPFLSYETLGKFLADKFLRQEGAEQTYRAPVREGVKVESADDDVLVTVLRFYQIPTLEGPIHEANITTAIKLPRVAGHIGYGKAHVSVEVEPLEPRNA